MECTDQPCALTTRTGLILHVRPATQQDEAALAEFFTHVTADDLRFRFLSSARHVPHDQLVAMTRTDHRRTEDFLAFTQDGSAMIASAMLACDDQLEHAEVAIAIRADYKARGVGWTLLAHVANLAAARGIKALESLESRDNHAAIEVEEDLGFVAEPVPDEPAVVRLSKRLTTSSSAGE